MVEETEAARFLALGERNLALIGFMTSGKTEVGRLVARLTGLPFVDVDEVIENVEGLPIHRIFREKGEPYFRGIETAVLRDLCRGGRQVIGCGGGTVLAEENRRLLQERCLTVWLQVSRSSILERLRHPDSPRRPLLEGLDLPDLVDGLLQTREPLYRKSDLSVSTDGRGAEQIAREIALRCGLPIFEGQE